MESLIALLAAILALLGSGETDTPFGRGVLAHGVPVYDPGTFVGLEDRRALPAEDSAYAGIVWIDAEPTRQTGP